MLASRDLCLHSWDVDVEGEREYSSWEQVGGCEEVTFPSTHLLGGVPAVSSALGAHCVSRPRGLGRLLPAAFWSSSGGVSIVEQVDWRQGMFPEALRESREIWELQGGACVGCRPDSEQPRVPPTPGRHGGSHLPPGVALLSPGCL